MNVVQNVQKMFLAEKQEPVPPPLPPRVHPEKRRQLTMDFMDTVDRTNEENAYLRNENEQLRVELRVAQETNRRLEAELNFERDQFDRVRLHDQSMLTSLDNIEELIVKAKAKARAEAYAPPGSGNQEPAADEQIDHAAELAKKLAPEDNQE